MLIDDVVALDAAVAVAGIGDESVGPRPVLLPVE